MIWKNNEHRWSAPSRLWMGFLPVVLGASLNIGQAEAQTLVGRAVLPADTFAAGPTSGQFIDPANDRTPPFINKQPVQGFSSILRGAGGSFLAMADNGFGSKANSPDFLLRVYRIEPDFRLGPRATNATKVKSFFTLSDPDSKIKFPIVADMERYPSSVKEVAVDPAIKAGRLLTGADFDIESFRQAADGTLWFGDEFGPFLLHTDGNGKVLDAPFALQGVASPDDPTGRPATLGRSKGFEGMAINKQGTRLYPMLEGPLTTDADKNRLIINEFDIGAKAYTGQQWFYRLEASASDGQAIGDLTAIDDRRFLVIERDSGQGATAKFKKIFLIDLDRKDADGFVRKTLVADLLNLADPYNLGGTGNGIFTFPFTTIEAVIPLSANTLGVLNDNNYPFSSGRTPGQPDDNEFIVIRLKNPLPTPIVIGHRGASGYRPEHTLASYSLAIQMGADFVEPDLVSTKDGILVARHENEISGTTNVADKPEFASRKATKMIDGNSLTGWFTEDFTLAELKTLRAKERLPQLRPQNTAFDNRYTIPTLQEVINLVKQSSARYHRHIGIYPETKHPTYFDGLGLSMEEPLVATLHRNGYRGRNAKVFIQSFEVSNLKDLRRLTQLPLIQLIDASGKPYDFTVKGDPRTYRDLVTPAGLGGIATYAQGIGPNKSLIVPRDADNKLLAPTSLVADAHSVGLTVHPFTFRRENFFLPNEFRRGNPSDANYLLQYGDFASELRLFFGLGLDGLFTDNPDVAVATRKSFFDNVR